MMREREREMSHYPIYSNHTQLCYHCNVFHTFINIMVSFVREGGLIVLSSSRIKIKYGLLRPKFETFSQGMHRIE